MRTHDSWLIRGAAGASPIFRKNEHFGDPETSGIETIKYAVIYEKTGTGYSAYIPDLPGCIAAGDTVEETEQLMRKAVKLHLKGLREDGDF